jgi:catechol 2,3-dioxygenase-like lactoylglutathione lyase family enzyme
MFDHIGLHVRDLAASVAFYEATLSPLGWTLESQDAESAAFGPNGESMLWLYLDAGSIPAVTHLAIRVTNRKAVDRFHAAGAKGGGRDNGPPRLRHDYSPTYYAAFLIDPDGNNVEAVCNQPE